MAATVVAVGGVDRWYAVEEAGKAQFGTIMRALRVLRWRRNELEYRWTSRRSRRDRDRRHL
jgi:hypothetical protein